MNSPMPFIVGCGRSGSTLLRSMLDAHPLTCVPNESYFLEPLLLRQDGFMTNGRFSLQLFLAKLEKDPRYVTWGVDTDVVRRALIAASPPDLASAVRTIYSSVASLNGSQRIVDKTPQYSLVVLELAELLPESVFVHLVRDPRNVAASYRDVSWGPRSLVSASMMWVERVGAARSAGMSLGPDRYLEVMYEKLIAAPEIELRRLCSFICLDFDQAMLHPELSRAARATARRDGGAHSGLLVSPTAHTRSWRSDLTQMEAARVGAVVDELATRFGYEPSPPLAVRGRPRFVAELLLGWGEIMSRRFRRTGVANVLRGPWRTLRGRATAEQLGIDPS